jgi:hypothetical protein
MKDQDRKVDPDRQVVEATAKSPADVATELSTAASSQASYLRLLATLTARDLHKCSSKPELNA